MSVARGAMLFDAGIAPSGDACVEADTAESNIPSTPPLMAHPKGMIMGSMPADTDGASPQAATTMTAGAALRSHRFIWDVELQSELEAHAVHLNRMWDKHQLAKVAKENYKLLKQGSYVDTSNQRHSLQVPSSFTSTTHALPSTASLSATVRHPQTRLCVARMDTASAARGMAALGEPAACLNFANQFHAGGGYLNGARAQEEDLCRLMPPLYTQLTKLRYPIKEHEAHFTRTLLARSAGTYKLEGPPLAVDIITAAMPNLNAYGAPKMAPRSHQWVANVKLRIRAVLHAAREQGCASLVLGAFGCGAFGNPPDAVAGIFRHCLNSDEFRGAFRTVVFAIIDPKPSDVGNFASFADALTSLCK